MELFIGFGVGMFFGGCLWWQTLREGDELYQEYCRLQRELMMTRRQLYVRDRQRRHVWPDSSDGPTTTPSRN
jgi:hypothetical protein